MTGEQLTDKQLKWAHWFVTRKTLFRQVGIGLFIFADAVLLLYAMIGAISYSVGTRRDHVWLKDLEERDATFRHVRQLPKPLVAVSVQALPSEGGTIDAVAVLSNPNSAWAARHIEYYFTIGGAPMTAQKGFLLPLKEQTFAQFAIPHTGGDIDVVVREIRWQRVRKNDLRDAGIETKDVKIVRPAANLPARLQFTATNTAPQGYWHVDFTVTGRSGAQTVGVSETGIDQFKFGESRTIEVPLTGRLGLATRFIIEPKVNVFDPGVFMPVIF